MNQNLSELNQKRILIIGGVAGGASTAARLRRLDEFAQITVLERGPDVSFANCGLPYFIGGEIKDREKLTVQTPQSLKAMLNLDVLTRHEATSVDLENKQVSVKDLNSGKELTLSYDKLVLTPGASPIIPPIPGIKDPRIHTLRNLTDMDQIVEKAHQAKHVLVIGAGFIGLEMAEQLRHLDKSVTLVELQSQVLPQLDSEMAKPVERSLLENGIDVILGDGINGFESTNSGFFAMLNSGKKVKTDLVILSIGVKPETQLAKDAGLKLGPRGHIIVNTYQQTSNPDIYAAGDAVETKCAITGNSTAVPLGGPANRQGRVIADHINNPKKAMPYPGSIGTAIVRVFDLAAGVTGLNEKRLNQWGLAYDKTIVSDFNHASYYPGATPLTVKLLFCPDTHKIYGAQVFGKEGVDKRLDIVATALRGNMTTDDLEHLELSYAPPFGSAKDVLNTAAFAVRNKRNKLVDCIFELPEDEDSQLIDVRPPAMQAEKPLPQARHIPISELRSRMGEIDKSKPVITICKMGKLSYFAARILQQNGYQVKSFSGGVIIR